MSPPPAPVLRPMTLPLKNQNSKINSNGWKMSPALLNNLQITLPPSQ